MSFRADKLINLNMPSIKNRITIERSPFAYRTFAVMMDKSVEYILFYSNQNNM